MMSKIYFNKPVKVFKVLCVIAFFIGCNSAIKDTANDKKQIINMLDSFNIAAAKADYNNYFKYYTDNAIFAGTDATERWDKKAFMVWAKPFFDKGTTWDFKAFDRHIYFDQTGNIAWFDELLSTQMKICRGSGVVVKQNEEWKIEQYILSTTIPNNTLDSVIKIKGPIEDSLIKQLNNK